MRAFSLANSIRPASLTAVWPSVVRPPIAFTEMTAIAVTMPMMTTTARISIRVKPAERARRGSTIGAATPRTVAGGPVADRPRIGPVGIGAGRTVGPHVERFVVGTGEEILVGFAPRVLGNLREVLVPIRRDGGRIGLRNQRLQTLLRRRVGIVVQLVHVQGG